MALLEKMAARRQQKSYVQAPFWTADGLGEPLWSSLTGGNLETIGASYAAYIDAAYKASGPVFACIRFRQLIFAEARFQWRQFTNGRPGELFGSTELALLETPWPSGTMGDLLARMEVTASLAGNYYATVADDEGRLGRSARGVRRIAHMRPDWTTIVIDSASGDPNALDAQVVGYLYEPPSTGVTKSEPVTLLPSEVCHYSPLADPAAHYRGMSWLTPIVEEVRADKAATLHKGKFFQNGAVPNLAVILKETVGPDEFERYVAKFKAAHQGADKAYKTMFLAGGADVRPLSADFHQMDFKNTQAMSETRIAMAAGVHPTVVGMTEGLTGSSLNAGNFNAAARLVANTTMRPLWRSAAASLQSLVTPPNPAAALWYDDRDIAFLHDDATDLADIRQKDAQSIRTLVDGGFSPDAAVEFMRTNDLSRLLKQHSGLLPVQLQPPGSDLDRLGVSSNGSVNGSQAALTR